MADVRKRDAGKTIQEKANVLWDVANSLAGLYKPHEYGLVILPMAVVKRFHDCLLPTYAKVQKEYAEQVNASGFMEQFARNAGSDPLLLLRAKESALESDMKAVKLEYDIFLQYLALLDYAGGLARQGVVNHLREGLK
jgi:type I restriction-modification system DNA methylase subunit